MDSEQLGHLLVRQGLITFAQQRSALEQALASESHFSDCLISQGFIDEARLLEVIAHHWGVEPVVLGPQNIDMESARLVPEVLARRYAVLAVGCSGGTMKLAMADPVNVLAIDDVGLTTGYHIVPLVALEASIRRAIDDCYGPLDQVFL